MSRNLIPLATLAVSAALTATGNPLAGAVAGGLAGNLATDLFKFLHRRVGERFFDGWSGVDENHHVTRALRLAQINALRAVLTDFTAATAGDPDIARQHEARRFTEVLTDFLDRETKAAQAGAFTADEDRAQAIRYEVLQALPDAFDQGLAARRTAQDRPAILDSLKQVQTVVEAGVLAEIRLQTLGPDGATHDRFAGFPPMFGACFAGTDDRDGWFGLFVRDAAAKIKDDGEFERIWNAEQVALVKAIVQADTEVLQEIAARVQRIETILGAPLRSGVTPVARNAASIRNRPTDLLVARYRVIPYIDRGGVLQEALAWARSPETPLPQGRLYVAPGGFGKTRFAIEMLRTLVDEHWTGTFLSPNNTANLGPGALASVMAEPGVTGCLIIVDYAESQIALLQQLAAAAAAAETATPIRILALARSAEGWWQGLQTHEGIATVFVGPDPIALIDRPLDAAERTLFLDTAIAAFQNAFAAVGLTTPPAAPLPIIGRDDDRPLTVAMAAFLAARGNAPTPGLSVFERIFIEERNNWKRVLHAQRDNEPAVDSLHRAAAQITLVQGATRAGAAALIDADPHHRGYDAAARDQSLASLEILFGADNGESLFLRPIEPDLLGEHVAMAALGPKNNGLIEATLTTALSEPSLFPQAVAAIFTVLTRATYDGHDARTVATAKAAIDRTCPVISGLDGAQVRRVEASLPRFAVPLTRLALAVAHRVVDTCENEPELARALSNLAVCLSETGDRSGALTPARRAAEIYQALAQDNPAAFLPSLAGSLGNLAYFLNETGDQSGAAAVAQRAAEIREKLV
ncbi:MAG: tetratricopeptide repeat protein [Azospirillaceae bacterium]|nr:tetratricopeptide repeat protein [Azospirillaceae bacterium]